LTGYDRFFTRAVARRNHRPFSIKKASDLRLICSDNLAFLSKYSENIFYGLTIYSENLHTGFRVHGNFAESWDFKLAAANTHPLR
jgi:hypothetical protein